MTDIAEVGGEEVNFIGKTTPGRLTKNKKLEHIKTKGITQDDSQDRKNMRKTREKRETGERGILSGRNDTDMEEWPKSYSSFDENEENKKERVWA